MAYMRCLSGLVPSFQDNDLRKLPCGSSLYTIRERKDWG
jgi:hypothetical protein